MPTNMPKEPGENASREGFVFVLILAAAAALLVFLLIGLALPAPLVALLLLLGAVVVWLSPRLVEVKEYERAVVFLLGRFYRVAGPGWHVFFPAIMKKQLVDMRTTTYDIHPQNVITAEDIRLKIDTIAYVRVTDPKKSVLEIRDLQNAIESLLTAQIRNVVGKMRLEEVLEKTEDINAALYDTLRQVEDEWGIKTFKVEITSIELPPSLVEAMKKRKEAEEHKTRLETEASARQVSLEILDRAASRMSDRTLSVLYLDALKKISEGKSNKVIFPLELSHLASAVAGKMGPKADAPAYDKIAEGLVAAYVEKNKKLLEENGSADKKTKAA